MACAGFGRMIVLVFAAAALAACDSEKSRTTEKAPAADSARVATPATDIPAARVPADSEAGAIRIVFSSNADGAAGELIASLLVSDARGRRAGFHPANGQVMEEIPGAWYGEDNKGAEGTARVLELAGAEPGAYTLIVNATKAGTYDLSIRADDASQQPTGEQFTNVSIDAGGIHSYIFSFDPASGVSVFH